MTTINIQKYLKLEYLESLSASDLAFWLVQSFSPQRYEDSEDCIREAIDLFKSKASSGLADEFVNRLWGMFGVSQNVKGVNNGVI